MTSTMTYSQAVPPSFNPDTRPLPDSWISQFDPNYQAWFYMNIHAQPPTKTWEHPLGPVPRTFSRLQAALPSSYPITPLSPWLPRPDFYPSNNDDHHTNGTAYPVNAGGRASPYLRPSPPSSELRLGYPDASYHPQEMAYEQRRMHEMQSQMAHMLICPAEHFQLQHLYQAMAHTPPPTPCSSPRLSKGPADNKEHTGLGETMRKLWGKCESHKRKKEQQQQEQGYGEEEEEEQEEEQEDEDEDEDEEDEDEEDDGDDDDDDDDDDNDPFAKSIAKDLFGIGAEVFKGLTEDDEKKGKDSKKE